MALPSDYELARCQLGNLFTSYSHIAPQVGNSD